MKLVLLTTAVIAIVGCGATADAPANPATAPVEMTAIPFGRPHPQFNVVDAEAPPFGVHSIGAPIVSGPLAGTFQDYTAQVDHFESRVLGARATRVMPSLDACREHHAAVEAYLLSSFVVTTDSTEHQDTLDLTAGDLRISLSCHFVSGSRHPTLDLSIFSESIASDVDRAWRERTGR